MPSPPDWPALARRIRATPEFAAIPFHPLAGRIDHDRQYFFEGGVTAYPWADDPGLHQFLAETQGAAEPQEIMPFLQALDALPSDAVMVELGAGWAMYSIVAGRRLPQARLFAVEAQPRLVELTRRNLALNGLADRATVIHAAAWDQDDLPLNFREGGYGSFVHPRNGDPRTDEYQVPGLSVDGLMSRHQLARIDLLHMDVQGAEARVLAGAARALAARAVTHIFIGTHSQALHEECTQLLTDAGYEMTVTLDHATSASGDGILIARRPF